MSTFAFWRAPLPKRFSQLDVSSLAAIEPLSALFALLGKYSRKSRQSHHRLPGNRGEELWIGIADPVDEGQQEEN